MVTNSANASRGLDRPVIRLILTPDPGELAILVRYNHSGVPQARHPGADDENGCALLLVDALGDRSKMVALSRSRGQYRTRNPGSGETASAAAVLT